MKVALYARVSSERQDVDLSISAQLKALREYAARNGYQVIKEFVDEAETGRTTACPAFRQMISLARRPEKPFDIILIWKYSRFARSREDSIVYKAMLRKNGVQVISITEPFDDTPTGRLLEAMIESLDEFYSDNLSEEVSRGMRESASRGYYISARAPYGYKLVKVRDGVKERPKLEIDPATTPQARKIFKDVLQGKGAMEIVKELNSSGKISPKRKGWCKTTIYSILTNEAYTGTLVWGKHSKHNVEPIRVENAWPALIDRDTFDAVQAQLKSRTREVMHPRRVASRYLLSGIARYGNCGKQLVGQDAKSGKFSYYVCGTLLKKGAGSCKSHYLNSDKFERLVIDKIKERVLTEENLKELVRLVNEEMDGITKECQGDLDAINDNVIDIDHRLERLYDALETGKIGLEDLVPRIQELRGRKEQLESKRLELDVLQSDRRVELASLKNIVGYVTDLRKLLNESPLAEKKAFIRGFVKEVKVTGNEVLLCYTMPLLPEGLSEEKAELQKVLPIVHYGGQYWI